MSDYRINIKVRNARLLRAIKKSGHEPGQKFADVVGIRYSIILAYCNLKRSPIDENGDLLPCAEKLMEFFHCMVSDLWSPEQLEPLVTNSAETDVSADQVSHFLTDLRETDPEKILEQKKMTALLDDALSTLTPRQAKILRMRFGIEGEELTLEAIGKLEGVSRDRIRQIENKAMRLLRATLTGYPNRELS